MAVSRQLISDIIRESCRTLHYDADRRRFSLLFRHYLDRIWGDLSRREDVIAERFNPDDFNALLRRIEELPTTFKRLPVPGEIGDSGILQGEILEIALSDRHDDLVIMKMEEGAYLDLTAGAGISFGSQIEFRHDACLTASDGTRFGTIASVGLRIPCEEHIIVSDLYMNRYYNNRISRSLWSIFEQSQTIRANSRNCDCSELLDAAKSSGIDIFVLLNIINAGNNER